MSPLSTSSDVRALALSFLIVLSMVAGTVPFAGVAGASTHEATTTITDRPDIVDPGERFSYSFDVTNDGSGDGEFTVTIDERNDADLQDVEWEYTGDETDRGIGDSFTVTLDSGESIAVDVTATAPGGAVGDINHEVAAEPVTGDGNAQVEISVWPVTQNFTGDTAPDEWEVRGDAEWNPENELGYDEWLWLTDTSEDQSGLGFLELGFPSDRGFSAEFTYYANEGDGADGTAFFLVDGDEVDDTNIDSGAPGGPLGYGYRSGENGIPHAYIGVGFDEFGNFVVEGGDTDYSTDVPDTVAIRGSGHGQEGYDYLTHTDVTAEYGETIDGGTREARVTVNPVDTDGDGTIDASTLTVQMKWLAAAEWTTVIDEYQYDETPPENLKLGFSGSTGGSTNIHAIKNLTVQRPPVVTGVHAGNPDSSEIDFQFDVTHQLDSVGVAVKGPDARTLDKADFTETERSDGTFTYRLDSPLTGNADGDYEVIVTKAENSDALDGAGNETDTITIAGPPNIQDFRINESDGDEVKLTIVADVRLFDIGVDIDGPGDESATRSRIDFTETSEDGNYTYTASYRTESAGTYSATLTDASDERGNDAASEQDDTVEIEEPPESEGGVRAAERGDNVFLGGDYFELGIRPDGGFGAEVTAPSDFFGSNRSAYPRGEIGMYADVDGFYNDTHDYRYEYFLPGSPEERWSIGYRDGESENTASAGRNVWSSSIDTTVTEDSDDNTARAIAESTYDDLKINQTYEFQPTDRHYKTTVTIENTGNDPIDGVHYQRSFDPDNGKDLGCSFGTNNTVHYQYPEDGRSLVSAAIQDRDSCDVSEVSDIPIFYYTTDEDARVSHGDFGLVPSNPPFGENEWNDAPESGANHVRDTYIAVTFNASTIEPDDSVTYTYYTALTEDFDTTLSEVEKSAGNDTEVDPPVADAGEDQDVSVNSTVRFDASGSTANLSIASYEWDFDDGTTTTGESPTHRFTDPGEYNVTLTVTDAADNSDEDNLTVTVSEPPGIQLSGTTPTFRDTKDPAVIDDELEVTGGEISGATVSIEGGFDPDEDELDASDNHGITSTYDSDTGVLRLAGDADAIDYQAVLRTVTYNNTADDPNETDREIAFTLGTDTVYSEETGHYYRYVTDEGITWTDARDAAEARDQFGLDGSLATITSEEENRFLLDRFEAGGWIGATDEDEESVWRWVTGPEGEEDGGDGRHFFTQTASHTGSHLDSPVYPRPPRGVPGGGEAVDDNYENWDPRHEPNNKWPMHGGQDYAYLCYDTRACTDGSWKDLNGTHSGEPTPQGYFVQFGGLENDPDVTLSGTTSVNVVNDQPPVADAGSDIETKEDAEITLDASNSTDDFEIADYHWDLGDGTTSTDESTTHSYSADGEYTVTLTVTDDADLEGVDLVNVTVIENTVIISNPGENMTVDEGSVFEMDGGGSEASEGIESYHWDFGDDTASGERPTYVYDEPGEYEVTLTITDTEDNTASATTNVTVRDVTSPTADAGEDQTVNEGDTVNLDASGSTDNVAIDTYEWDTTGNGRINETGETPTTVFNVPGEYDVTLYATDTSGNVETDTVTITVEDTTDPTPDAGGNVSVGQGERVDFDGTNSTDNVAIEKMTWDFGAGSTEEGSTVTHRFSDDISGEYEEYEVTLTVTDTNGNTATDTLTVNVTAAPEITTNSTAAEYVEASDPADVGGDISITYPDEEDLDGAEVVIGDGFESGDRLEYNSTLANTLGISGNYVSESGVLSLDGEANAMAYEQVLETVEYEYDGSDPTEENRTITFSIGTGALYFTDTGHYYEYVDDPGISWHDARDAADNRTHYGLQGYLVTLTSSDENDFVHDKLRGAGWIGASDTDEEGVWRWVTGPEGEEGNDGGRHFFTQTGSDTGLPDDVYGGTTPGGGDAVGENYTNWNINEPNDYRDGEDFAHLCYDLDWCADGTWNDFEANHSDIDGYVIEYGGTSDDPTLDLSDSRTVNVTRDRPPAAEAGTDLEVGTSDQIELDASDSTDDFGIDSYRWNFGDGNTSTGETTIHSYGSDGNYTVTLTAYDTAMQSDTDSITVTVIDDSILVANAGSNTTIDEGETVELEASASEASAGIDSYSWDIGANGTEDGTGDTISETFDDPGEYPVNLTIKDTLGNSTTTTTYVLVQDTTPPSAAIDGNDRTVDNGTSVRFNASDTEPTHSDIETYEWDFTGNDRTDETGIDPTFTFVEPGKYNVTLTVTDESGNVDVDHVNVTVADVTPPTVNAGDDRTVQAGDEIAFDGSDSYDDVAIDDVEWDFGDGTTSDELVANHTYGTGDEGEHEVTLTLTDTNDNEASDTLNVTVENTQPSISNVTLGNPADFNISVAIEVDQSLDTLEVDLDGPESQTLGLDDFTETVEDGTYTYEAVYEGDSAGEYTATVLKAVDALGNDGASDQNASVRTLDADARAGSYVAGVGTSIELSASNSHDPGDLDPDFKWDIRDNGTIDYTGETVSHEFMEPGEIDVTLSLQTDAHTVNDTITIEIQDRVAPDVKLDADETVSENSPITFDASKSTDDVEITDFEWDFGDGTTASGASEDNPSHTYTTPGTYTVSVTARDAANNTETNSTTVTVEGPISNVSSTDFDYGDIPEDSSGTTAVRVQNDGTTQLTIEDTTGISGPDSDKFELTGSAASELPIDISPGGSAPVAVTYEPGEVGDHEATLELETDDDDYDVDLTGSGVDSDLSADTDDVAFADTDVGEDRTATITLDNDGSATATLDDVTIDGLDASEFEVVSSPDSIGAGASGTITVEFAPTIPGELTGMARVRDENGDTTASVSLAGTGIGPSMHVADDEVPFGDVGVDVSTAETVELRNVGNADLDVEDVYLTGSDTDPFDVESAPGVVGSDDTADIQFSFAPEEPGEYEATLVVETNDTDSPLTIAVNGTGVAAAIGADPRSVNFEDVEVGETVHTRIEVRNLVRSKTDLEVSSTPITGRDAEDFVIENGGAPFTLSPGQVRYINLSFTPSDVEDKQAQLQIHSDAGNEPQINVWLSSSDSYIVVQEVAADDETITSSTVNVDARNVDVGSDLVVNVSQPGTRERPVGFDEIGMITADEESFKIDGIHDDEPPSGPDAQTYEGDGLDTLQYVRLNHTVDAETNFTDTSVTFRVKKEHVKTDDPDDTSLHRWNDTHDEWREMDLTLVGESTSYYVFTSETPGFSQFVVTAPSEGDDESDSSGGSPSGSMSSFTGDGETADDEPETTPTDDESEETPTDDEPEETPASDDTRDASDPPTGDVTNDDRWVHPDDLPVLEIVDVRLETEPTNSVYATSTITIENPSTIEQDAEVRFILNGEVVEEVDVTVPGSERIDVDHTELVTEPGFHEFQANVATQTEDDELVRTFDFDVGVVELDEDDCELFGYDFGSFIVCWYWWALLFLLLVSARIAYYLIRDRENESDE